MQYSDGIYIDMKFLLPESPSAFGSAVPDIVQSMANEVLIC